MSLFAKVVLSATHNPIVARAVTRTAPGRAVAGRFVAGDGLDDALATVEELLGDGFTVSLDLLGEEVLDRESAVKAADAYLDSMGRVEGLGGKANVSVKLTQLGLGFDKGLASDLVERLATRAAEVGTTVTIDMEASNFTQATLDLYAESQERHGNLGVCLQAYLRRTPNDLDWLMPLGGHIRLCKGAYVEPESLAFTTRAEVDAAFARLLETLMSEPRVKPAIATHDDRLIDLTLRHASTRSEPWEMQMLFGVRSQLQAQLAEQGHPVRVYVPFGSEWYAYLTRRLAERPANLAFFARALIGRN